MEQNGNKKLKIWEVEYGQNMSKDWLVADTIDAALALAKRRIEEGVQATRGKAAKEEWRELNEPSRIEFQGETDA